MKRAAIAFESATPTNFTAHTSLNISFLKTNYGINGHSTIWLCKFSMFNLLFTLTFFKFSNICRDRRRSSPKSVVPTRALQTLQFSSTPP